MILDRAQVERLVPHAGAMCLLDSVHSSSATEIHCSGAGAHDAHPLSRDGVLPSIAACEYAAQAAAVHGALLDDAQAAQQGMLASLMDVELHAAQFAHGAVVDVHAQRGGSVDAGCLYSFTVSCGEEKVASGRLIVAFTKP